jgi:predicted transcriptional regulator
LECVISFLKKETETYLNEERFRKYMEEVKLRNAEAIAKTFSALSDRKKIEAFLLLLKGENLTEISRIAGIPRSSLQRYMEAYHEGGLIGGEAREYRLEKLGEEILEIMKKLDEIWEKEKERREREKLETVAREAYGILQSPITREMLDKLLKVLKEEETKEKG